MHYFFGTGPNLFWTYRKTGHYLHIKTNIVEFIWEFLTPLHYTVVDIAGMTAASLHCAGLCLKEGGHNTWQFSEIVCLDQIINSHQFRVNLADIGDTFKGPQANFNPCYMHWSYYVYRVFCWFIKTQFYVQLVNRLHFGTFFCLGRLGSQGSQEKKVDLRNS